ncbi:hypothetical protein MRX96_019336 [Rhipicephalus microplus]
MVMPNTNNKQLHASNHRGDSLRSADSRQTASQHRSPVAASHARWNSPSSCHPSLLFFPVIATAVTGAAIFLQFFNTPTDTLPDDPDTQSYTRIMKTMLQMLWRTGKCMLDPCKDFYRGWLQEVGGYASRDMARCRSSVEGSSLSHRDSCLLKGDAWLRLPRPQKEPCLCSSVTVACGR